MHLLSSECLHFFNHSWLGSLAVPACRSSPPGKRIAVPHPNVADSFEIQSQHCEGLSHPGLRCCCPSLMPCRPHPTTSLIEAPASMMSHTRGQCRCSEVYISVDASLGYSSLTHQGFFRALLPSLLFSSPRLCLLFFLLLILFFISWAGSLFINSL